MAITPAAHGSIVGLGGFRPGKDYRQSDAWKELEPKRAQEIVRLAKEWIAAYDNSRDPTVQQAEALYREVFSAVPDLRVDRTQFPVMPYTRAFGLLQELGDALSSGAISGGQSTGLDAVKAQLRLSAADTVLQLRNAALQQAQEEYQAAKRTSGGPVSGGRGV